LSVTCGRSIGGFLRVLPSPFLVHYANMPPPLFGPLLRLWQRYIPVKLEGSLLTQQCRRGVGVDRKVGEACLRNGPKRGKGKFSKLLSKTKSKKQKVICLQTVVLYNNCLLPCKHECEFVQTQQVFLIKHIPRKNTQKCFKSVSDLCF
jgi:hypothetical protein